MRILIVFNVRDTDNLFVPTLLKGIKGKGIDIECSVHKFWEDNSFYDIIHFQWPEEVIGWNCCNNKIVEELQSRINFLKSQGSKFVYTRHNEYPHHSNSIAEKAYKIIESQSDIIVHLGQYSYDSFLVSYPNSENIIIPHHIYEETYDENISPQEARKKLNIPKDKFVITSFGKFRNKQEISMVLKAFFRCKIKRKYLLAPRLIPFSAHPQHRNIVKKVLSYLAYYIIITICKLLHIKAGGNEDLISNNDLPNYILASDVVFVQRINILNSGNIPLAFLFRKVVLGPNKGNIGELLSETGNPKFSPKENESIIAALQQAYILCNENKGEENYRYALIHFSLALTSQKYINVYKKALMK